MCGIVWIAVSVHLDWTASYSSSVTFLSCSLDFSGFSEAWHGCKGVLQFLRIKNSPCRLKRWLWNACSSILSEGRSRKGDFPAVLWMIWCFFSHLFKLDHVRSKLTMTAIAKGQVTNLSRPHFRTTWGEYYIWYSIFDIHNWPEWDTFQKNAANEVTHRPLEQKYDQLKIISYSLKCRLVTWPTTIRSRYPQT